MRRRVSIIKVVRNRDAILFGDNRPKAAVVNQQRSYTGVKRVNAVDGEIVRNHVLGVYLHVGNFDIGAAVGPEQVAYVQILGVGKLPRADIPKWVLISRRDGASISDGDVDHQMVSSVDDDSINDSWAGFPGFRVRCKDQVTLFNPKLRSLIKAT